MRVEILNPEVLENLYKNHGEFACTCYDTPMKFAEKVGQSCCKANGHMSGSRAEYIKFRLYDIDRGTAEQIMRHEIGNRYDNIDKYSSYIEQVLDVNPTNIVKNMQSFRYVDKNGFGYETPKNIQNIPEAKSIYDSTMALIDEARNKIQDILLENCIHKEKAIEDANFVLPRATTLTLTIAMTPEALIEFEWKRLCKRAQDEIKAVAVEIKRIVSEINPRFAKELTPHCQHLLWCPEHKGCGAYPTRTEVEEIILNAKKVC